MIYNSQVSRRKDKFLASKPFDEVLALFLSNTQQQDTNCLTYNVDCFLQEKDLCLFFLQEKWSLDKLNRSFIKRGIKNRWHKIITIAFSDETYIM